MVSFLIIYSPGELLASAGDGGTLILWKQSDHPIQQSRLFGQEDDEVEGGSEHWNPVAMIRVSDGEDVYDLAWSPDDRHILIGLTDNTAQVWELATRNILKDDHFDACRKVYTDT